MIHAPLYSLQHYLQWPRYGSNLNIASAEEWIKKMWWIYTARYYSTIKKYEKIPFEATWMNLEIVILSEVRERKILYNILYMHNLKRNDISEFIYKTETDS